MASIGTTPLTHRTRSSGRSRLGFFCGLVLVGLLPVSPAHAQVADSVPAPDLWRFRTDLALTATSGNEDFAVFTAGVQLQHLQVEVYEFELDTQARYGRSDGEDIARKLQGSVKFDFHPEARWSPFFFLQAEHDPIRSLSLRTQGGAGAKYTFWQEAASEYSLSLAALYDREKLVDLPAATLGRWSWRAKVEQGLAERLRISNTTFYQPVWDRPGDYLVTVRTELTTKMTENLSLNVMHLYERDSTPPVDIQPSDMTLTVGLRLEL